MNLSALYAAVKARAAADSGSGGLFASTPLINGFYFNRIPSTTNFPYVVAVLGSTDARNCFNKDVVEVTLRFSIWHETVSHTDSDTLNTVSKIEARLYGGWSSSAPATPPSYGFHRHTLTGVTGWTASVMEWRGVSDESDGDLYHMVQTYRFLLSA